MAKWSRRRGATSQILDLFIQDSASTTGAGKTGLTSASAGLVVSVKRELAAAYTVYAQASSNIETITTIGTFAAPTASKCRFKEIDATNAPGMYQLMLADAIFDAGDASRFVSGIAFGASGMAPVPFEVELEAVDRQDTVRFGLTALPNAAAEAAGGLYTRGSGAGQINQPANGLIDTNLMRWLGTAAATPATAGIPRVAIEAAADFAQGAADKVWLTASRTLTSFGTLVADVATAVWTAGTRTLTSTGTLVADVVTGVGAMVIEGTVTLIQSLRLSNAGNAGKTDGQVPGVPSTVHLRDLADTKNRVTASVDANGNRTAVTTDVS